MSTKLNVVPIIAAVLIASILIMGCTAQGGQGQPTAGPQGNGSFGPGFGGRGGGFRNGTGGYGNLTPEQRQQMMAQRQQQAMDACNGKAQGDSCDISFGNRTTSGTCDTGNSTALECRIQRSAPTP